MKIYRDPKYILALNRRRAKIGVVGLGIVGLALATHFASSGYRVYGYDIDTRRVDDINSSRVKFEYSKELRAALSRGKISAHKDLGEVVANAELIVVAVPTPLSEEKNADLSYATTAAKSIAAHLERGQIVIFECTMPIGSTRKLAALIEQKSGLRLGRDFGVGLAPERYDPSLIREQHPRIVYDGRSRSEGYRLENIPKVVSGIDKRTADILEAFYRGVFKAGVFRARSVEVAEASKLLENTFRNVNIALVNELSVLFSKLGFDTYDVIEAARTKPFAFMPHYPGPGVGGECIPVVPWFLVKRAEESGLQLGLTKMALETNDSMPGYVKTLVESALEEAQKGLSTSKVALLGLAYKKNVADTRLSPTIPILTALESAGASVHLCDPLVGELKDRRLKTVSLDDAIKGADVLLLVTDHDAFKKLGLKRLKSEMNLRPAIVDARNFFDEESCRKNGFIYRGIGKSWTGAQKE